MASKTRKHAKADDNFTIVDAANELKDSMDTLREKMAVITQQLDDASSVLDNM